MIPEMQFQSGQNDRSHESIQTTLFHVHIYHVTIPIMAYSSLMEL